MHRDKCYRMSEVYRELLEEGVSFTLSKIDLKKIDLGSHWRVEGG